MVEVNIINIKFINYWDFELENSGEYLIFIVFVYFNLFFTIFIKIQLSSYCLPWWW